MNVYLSIRTVTHVCAIALSAGVAVSAFPIQAIAQTYNPPSVGLPGRREGGGTRGECSAVDKTLTAIMPENNFGYTLDEYPTLYWYVPQIGAEAAEFVLLDENNNEIYITTFQITDQPGLISLSLPSNAGFPPLELGKDYHWYFSLICDFNDRSGDLFTDGWIRRTSIESGSSLDTRLSTESEDGHAVVYAEEGIWYNALDLLAEDWSSNSGDSQVQSEWSNFLNSVGLTNLTDEPFVLHIEGEPQSQTDL